LDPARKEQLDRFQAWAFVAAAVLALLTFPVVGLAFSAAAIALGWRLGVAAVRWAGVATMAMCAVVLALGLGSGEGGGLVGW
jgi:hypothetical protein